MNKLRNKIKERHNIKYILTHDLVINSKFYAIYSNINNVHTIKSLKYFIFTM